MLTGLPVNILAPLQRALNAAAHLTVSAATVTASATIFGRCTGCRLPARFASNCLMMHAVNNGTNPAYIMDIKTPIASLLGHCRLRSSFNKPVRDTSYHFMFGDRAFSVAGRRKWTPWQSLWTSGTLAMFHSLNTPSRRIFRMALSKSLSPCSSHNCLRVEGLLSGLPNWMASSFCMNSSLSSICR